MNGRVLLLNMYQSYLLFVEQVKAYMICTFWYVASVFAGILMSEKLLDCGF